MLTSIESLLSPERIARLQLAKYAALYGISLLREQAGLSPLPGVVSPESFTRLVQEGIGGVNASGSSGNNMDGF